MSVIVCSECQRASCWQGVHMCQRATRAGIEPRTRTDLERMGLEHPEWWDVCPDHGVALTQCRCAALADGAE